VPESSLAINGAWAAGGRLFVGYLENVATHIRSFDIDGETMGNLSLPGIGPASISGGRWADDEAFFSFTSFAEPSATYQVQCVPGRAKPLVPPEDPD